MTEPALGSAVVVWTAGESARLVWAQRRPDAPALPGFHVAPGGLLDPADADAPSDGGRHEDLGLRVAGLRELFEETGILHADGAIEADARAQLRRRFQRAAPELGHSRMRAMGLRWRTRDLVPIGRWLTPAFAPRRFDARFFGLRLDAAPPVDAQPEELAAVEWIAAADARARWARGGCLITPPLAWLLRSMATHGELRAEEARRVYGAQGEAAQRWEVVPGVQMLPFRTPTLPPATMTNSYLVGSGEAVIVEPATPYPDEQARMLRWIEEATRHGITPRALLLTHHHGDHIGAAAELKQRLGLPLWAHRETAARLRVPVERTLEEGERISLAGPDPVSLRVLHTPGHAPGHLCFLEERSGVLIAGDMVASIGTIVIEPSEGDMAVYLDQLRRLADLAPSMLLPAHGLPILDPQAKLHGYIQHRLAREARVLEALRSHGGPATPRDLVPVAYDDAPREVWGLAALSTQAHLVKLVQDGAAERDGERWVAAG